MRRPCSPVAVALAVTVTGAALLGAAPGAAMAQPAPPPPPVVTPDTSHCPHRMAPPPAVADAAPEPGTAGPASLPLPDEPVGGERMGECGTVLPAGAPPPPVGITAASWLIADLDTGEVLAAKDPHGRHRPASTIKLLTALVAVETLPLDRVVTTTRVDADIEGSSAGIGPGGRYTVRQLLAGLLLVSGNDTAHALARTIGGQPTTLAAMNARARELGATDTRAGTPSGLDVPGMSSSAYDMALIFREVLRTPALARLLATPEVTFPGYRDHSRYLLGNQNRLLATYEGALGGKTGFTDDARHTFLGAAERDGHRLVAVLMRAEQKPTRTWEQAARLLDYGFALEPGTDVGRLVTGPPEPEPATTTPPPAQDDLAAGRSPSGGADPASSSPDSAGTGTGTVIGSLLAGTAVLAGVLALLLRTRRDPRS
ncbi:MAG: penicillin-binding protein [Pseudonocardiaceae bacterium]|nr:penicillin-binding protein [Pseudonocardiaceae bacterium]